MRNLLNLDSLRDEKNKKDLCLATMKKELKISVVSQNKV